MRMSDHSLPKKNMISVTYSNSTTFQAGLGREDVNQISPEVSEEKKKSTEKPRGTLP